MSNLLKQYYVVQQQQDKRVINSNGLVEERIRHLTEEKKAPQFIPSDLSGSADQFKEGVFSQGLEAVTVQPEPQPDPQEIAKEILSEARDKADQMLNDAHMQAHQIVEDAKLQAEQYFEEQKMAGYMEGARAREEELAEMERQLQEECTRQEIEMNCHKEELDSEFQLRMDEMEGEIIDALIPVFDKVFHIQFGDCREILYALVRSTLMNIELGDKIRIRVNEADKAMLSEHLDEIREQTGSDVSIELLQDVKFTDGQCQIETAYGVFDCGIDTQFDNLVKGIRALV